MPLLRTSLSDLPNGYICLSTAKRQSLASKTRRNDGTGKVKMGKKPDIMALEKCNGKLVKFLYVESSRIVCSPTKKTDDKIKLWRELLDESSYISSACRSICNQFERLYLIPDVIITYIFSKTKVFANFYLATSSVQSEGTYITDVIMPLLRTSLSDLPNGYICLSTAKRQSLASKTRRNDGTGKVKMGKKPDIMALEKCNGKLVKFLYVESSRIVCSPTKKTDDKIKLWRELLDESSYISSACRSICNQFGIVGVQVAGEKIYLNVLVNDASGIPRYFHLDHAEIPLTVEVRLRTKALMRLLLTLRNIIIVNKNLLKYVIEQAVSHSPRNTSPSPIVTTLQYE
ncbi:hypothetical protein Glove_767g13 [Diversispora epigaea]|uniref:Uncharacterized protein n=1 Tax=Diversispora epigaea TaxID=1348612 RepID=A0A397G1X5_9GLOM|nr:hypothetical protein Glove_767g13 [Diversispora epigaea]